MTPKDISVLQAELNALRGDLQEAVRELKEGHGRIEAENRDRLSRIEEQTKLHNGRMSKAEAHLATLRGGLIVLGTLTPFATALLIEALVK